MTTYLKDYKQPDFLIPNIELYINIFDSFTVVTATLHIVKQNLKATVLQLDCDQQIALLDCKLNDKNCDYQRTDVVITIEFKGKSGTVTTQSKIFPKDNHALLGLYQSRQIYCSQCEAEGFRRITPFIDRPDILSEYKVTIEAQSKLKHLLSNGNVIASCDFGDRHSVTWHDPFKKPCYLFAVVAGNLKYQTDTFITKSHKLVTLKIFTEPHNIQKCDFAMQSLKQAMRWDEQQYGREYDLDLFMIVAVDDFNMGAMENKGLNIFNSQAILAAPKIATDTRFMQIQGIVAHEYFHNWTGNRVTCRDWFQLSLKEGLTVFRDACFSEDYNDAAIKRIEDVNFLKEYQFNEDSGPLAHPVQPKSYQAIDNFYTTTIYEKGAEIVRMAKNWIGPELFRLACDRYFERFDQQAVTIEDFYQCLEHCSNVNFDKFMRWYQIAGTPIVTVTHQFKGDQLQLTMTQSPPAVAVKTADKAALTIPIKLALISKLGDFVPMRCDKLAQQGLLESTYILTNKKSKLIFNNVPPNTTVSLLRDFSAPVILQHDLTEQQLQTIMQYETDAIACYNAACELVLATMTTLYHQPDADCSGIVSFDLYCESILNIIQNALKNNQMTAQLLYPVTLRALVQHLVRNSPCDISVANRAFRKFYTNLAKVIGREILILNIDKLMAIGSYQPNIEQMAKRLYRERLIKLLAHIDSQKTNDYARQIWQNSDNLTDTIFALQLAIEYQYSEKNKYLQQFFTTYCNESTVLTKYFALQVASKYANVALINSLLSHSKFKLTNPNLVYAIFQTLCQNLAVFHAKDGKMYQLLAEIIVKVDKINPNVSANLARNFSQIQWVDVANAKMMQTQIQFIIQQKLTKNTDEIINAIYREITN